MPIRTKVYQEILFYRGVQTDQFALGKLCSNVFCLFLFLFLFFSSPECYLLQRRRSRYSASSPYQKQIEFEGVPSPFLQVKDHFWLTSLWNEYIGWMLPEWKSLCSFKSWDGKCCYLAFNHEQFLTTVSVQQKALQRGREKVDVKNCI